jgi:large subunit ribosomal protein L24
VLRVEPRRNRLFVEGLNMVKRHQRPRSLKDTQRGTQVGGVIEKEAPIHVSNVMIVDPKDNRPTRIGVERSSDGGRERITRRSKTKLTT